MSIGGSIEPGWYHADGDPVGTQRYWNGTEWVGDPVGAAPAASAPVGAGFGQVAQRDGKLIASGILAIISGSVVALGAIWLLLLANSSELDILDDLTGNAFTMVAIFGLFVAGLYLAPGIGCVKGAAWGRIMNIVVQGIALALFLLGLIGAAGEGGSDVGGVLIPIIWTGLILGLAIAGKPWR